MYNADWPTNRECTFYFTNRKGWRAENKEVENRLIIWQSHAIFEVKATLIDTLIDQAKCREHNSLTRNGIYGHRVSV
jgi:hypothetical protein